MLMMEETSLSSIDVSASESTGPPSSLTPPELGITLTGGPLHALPCRLTSITRESCSLSSSASCSSGMRPMLACRRRSASRLRFCSSSRCRRSSSPGARRLLGRSNSWRDEVRAGNVSISAGGMEDSSNVVGVVVAVSKVIGGGAKVAMLAADSSALQRQTNGIARVSKQRSCKYSCHEELELKLDSRSIFPAHYSFPASAVTSHAVIEITSIQRLPFSHRIRFGMVASIVSDWTESV